MEYRRYPYNRNKDKQSTDSAKKKSDESNVLDAISQLQHPSISSRSKIIDDGTGIHYQDDFPDYLTSNGRLPASRYQFSDLPFVGAVLFGFGLAFISAAIVADRREFWLIAIGQLITFFILAYTFYRAVKISSGIMKKVLIGLFLLIGIVTIIWYIFNYLLFVFHISQPILIVIILFVLAVTMIAFFVDLTTFILSLAILFWYIFLLVFYQIHGIDQIF